MTDTEKYPWLVRSPEYVIETRRGTTHSLPIFLPVCEQGTTPISVEDMLALGARGFISNAFFLYRERETRKRVLAGEYRLRDYLGLAEDHPYLLMTDSGAYQSFRQRVLLDNKKIVSFQDALGADIISPLDLVGNVGEGLEESRKKTGVTLKRCRQGLERAKTSILAGVQQGGRHPEIRRWCLQELLDAGFEYIAIGSLVPFFTRKRNIGMAFSIIREAREMAGPTFPLHIFGSGDPLEVPFFAACGGNVFDSSSFAHYALSGNYMTPFGAVDSPDSLSAISWTCPCPACAEDFPSFSDVQALTRHNLAVILKALDDVSRAAEENRLHDHLNAILETHTRLFQDERLATAWRAFQTRDDVG